MKPMNIILIGALIAILGGIITAFGTWRQNKSSSEKSTRIEDGIVIANKEIESLKIENSSLKSDLLRVYKTLTGGESFCQMNVGDINREDNVGRAIFSVTGETPLQQVSVRVVFLNITDTTKPSRHHEEIFNFDTLYPNRAYFTKGIIELDKTTGLSLNIFFTTSNGFPTQLIRMQYFKRKWVRATLIKDTMTGKEIYSKIDPEYPVQDKIQIFAK